MVNDEEIWKTYPDYHFIEASNLGRVRTVDRIVNSKNGREYHIKGRVLKQHFQKNGYMSVSFRMYGKKVLLLVHRIIAACFCPNPNNYPQVNHKDNDRTNNVADNLEWCTPEYNIAYREKYGIACSRPVFAVDLKTGKVFWFESQMEASRQLGIDIGNLNNVVKCKMNQTGGYWFTEDENEITEERIREIKAKTLFHRGIVAINSDSSEVFLFESQHEAARQLGVSQGNVNSVLKGRSRKTRGWWFCYTDENSIEKVRAKFGDEVAEKVEKLMRGN